MKYVDIILPIRNEAKIIDKVLFSLCYQEGIGKYFFLNIIIVDNQSTDSTVAKANKFFKENFSQNYSYQILINQNKPTASAAFNLGFKKSSNKYVMRLDGHSIISSNYIISCFEFLDDKKHIAIGGSINHFGNNNSIVQKSIAEVMNHPLLTAGSFRSSHQGYSSLIEVDTIAFALQLRKTFLLGGLYDETMIRNQDDLHCFKQKKNGVQLFLLNTVSINQRVRNTYFLFFRQYFEWGLYKPSVFIKSKKLPRYKLMLYFLIAFIFFILAIFQPIIFFYFILLIFLFYFFISKSSFIDRVGFMTAAFIMHSSYFLGFLFGLFFLFRKK